MRRQCAYAGVDSRDGDERARRTAAAVHDVDLGAADVELRAAVAAGDVKSNLWTFFSYVHGVRSRLTHLLNAEEVLAAGQTLREGEVELLLG